MTVEILTIVVILLLVVAYARAVIREHRESKDEAMREWFRGLR